jgi:hypothetical protein
MSGISREPSLKLLLNDLMLAKSRADGLGLTIVASLISTAMINVSAASSFVEDEPIRLNDNQAATPSSQE